MLRRVAFIRVAQRVGLTLDEIRAALATLPEQRTPTAADWSRLSRAWKSQLDERIRLLESVRDELSSCIGCGCLSLQACRLYNPDDRARVLGQGPRYLLGDPRSTSCPSSRRARVTRPAAPDASSPGARVPPRCPRA